MSVSSNSVEMTSSCVFVCVCVWLGGQSRWGVGLLWVEMVHSSTAMFLNHQTDVQRAAVDMPITHQGHGKGAKHTPGQTWPHIEQNTPQGHMNAIYQHWSIFSCNCSMHTSVQMCVFSTTTLNSIWPKKESSRRWKKRQRVCRYSRRTKESFLSPSLGGVTMNQACLAILGAYVR